jgi:hypothetical protein
MFAVKFFQFYYAVKSVHYTLGRKRSKILFPKVITVLTIDVLNCLYLS